VTLPQGVDWVHPNAEERGYYRWSVPAPMLATLAAQARSFTPRERVGFVNNLAALLDGGSVPADEFLRLLAPFGDDAEPLVVTSVTVALNHAYDAFATPENADAFGAYVRRTLTPAWTRIGTAKRADESATVTLLRAELMRWLGDQGRDETVRAQARALADAYLADPASIDASLASVALELSAAYGDAALYQRYRTRFAQATAPVDRKRLVVAMGHFRDPVALRAALDGTLDGSLRPQEVYDLFRAARIAPANQDAVWSWMVEHHAALVSHIPTWRITNLTGAAGGCSPERIAAGRMFFTDPARRYPGVEVEFKKIEDAAKDCIRLRAREGAAATAYLMRLALAP
jgi:aminopeptidase N